MMLNRWIFLFVFAVSWVFGSSYSIVFVHIGDQLPDYLETALVQARLFNKECPIFVVGNAKAFRNTSSVMNEQKITLVPLEKLPKSIDHLFFQKKSKLDRNSLSGFWTYTTERFFYLSELIDELNLKNVFHLENDNMLYANLEELLPVFEKNYPGVGLVMFNDDICVPSFMYIANRDSMKELCSLVALLSWQGKDDMFSLGAFKKSFSKEIVDCLPLIMPGYPENLPMISNHPEMFSNHLEEFNSVFDGASLGQYLDGMNPRVHNENLGPGYIRPECVFNPAALEIEWVLDEESRNVPYISYKGDRYRINNLHIHSKKLANFKS